MRTFATSTIASLFATVASADTWICVSEAATGFTKIGETFQSQSYRAGRTYIMRPAKPEDEVRFVVANMTYVFETIGNPEGPYALFVAEVKRDGVMVSSMSGTTAVEFNPSTLKFSLLSTLSYMFQMNEDEYLPFLEIGSCSAM
jgi:hypothetical protein